MWAENTTCRPICPENNQHLHAVEALEHVGVQNTRDVCADVKEEPVEVCQHWVGNLIGNDPRSIGQRDEASGQHVCQRQQLREVFAARAFLREAIAALIAVTADAVEARLRGIAREVGARAGNHRRDDSEHRLEFLVDLQVRWEAVGALSAEVWTICLVLHGDLANIVPFWVHCAEVQHGLIGVSRVDVLDHRAEIHASHLSDYDSALRELRRGVAHDLVVDHLNAALVFKAGWRPAIGVDEDLFVEGAWNGEVFAQHEEHFVDLVYREVSAHRVWLPHVDDDNVLVCDAKVSVARDDL